MSSRSSVSSASDKEEKKMDPPPYTDRETPLVKKDAEAANEEKKLKYPKSVFFIVTNEFCERFSYYGMRTILSLYLNKALGFQEDTATVLYHVFVMLCYFTPILGAIIADTFLGKYKTILYVSMIYALGNVVLSIGAIPNTEWQPGSAVEDAYGVPQTAVSLIGLFIIAMGTGGIKPCVAAFGGDQFVRPQQEKQLVSFFSIFYFSINAGSLLSTVITPILRDEVECAGVETCYPLAFGVPAVLFAFALVIFIAGKSLYIIKPPEGNVIVDTCKCMGHAISQKWKGRKGDKKRDHWLDYADDKYGKDLISDLKGVLSILLLYIPVPLFWALFDQQGSRWTFQATRMDGNLGGGFVIKPDQMQVVNPLLILLFVPIFEAVFYPLFEKCGFLHRPLQKMVFGGTLAAVAFVISGIIETQLEPTYAKLPPTDLFQLNIHNTIPCNLSMSLTGEGQAPVSLNIEKLSSKAFSDDSSYFVKGEYSVFVTATDCPAWTTPVTKKMNFNVYPSASVMISYDTVGTIDILDRQEMQLEKTSNGNPSIRFLYDFKPSVDDGKKITFQVGSTILQVNQSQGITLYTDRVEAGDHKIAYAIDDGDFIVINDATTFLVGAVYEIAVRANVGVESKSYVSTLQLTSANTLSILLLIPQYVLITMGEVMFSPIGLQFSFTQAPESMKSLIQGLWQLTVAFGNLIVIIVAEAKIFPKQSDEFFLFAGLMAADSILLAFLAYRYKYKEVPKDDDDKKSISSSGSSGKANDGFVKESGL